MWKRSLWLYQSYCLWTTPWYLPLIKALARGPHPSELLSHQRVKSGADIFGETPPLTVVRLLQTIEAVHGQVPAPVVDLGCGRGVACLTAASLGYSALGIEQEAAWVRAAEAVASQLSLPASFVAADLREAPWPGGGTFLAVATAFPQSLRKSILERLRSLPAEETLLVTVDWEITCRRFEQLWTGRLPVDWGVAQFAVWRPAAPKHD